MPFDMGELIVDEGATVGDTSISPRVIRDLLNRPRGLNAATIVGVRDSEAACLIE